MNKVSILWADDEIDLLKPHLIFLSQKGYEVSTAKSGNEALDLILEKRFDIVFLDENMPGLSGLETLTKIKNRQPGLPVVMITKSEEESIMNEAIGSNISDYLIKPVNPNQILLSLKKNLENKRLVSEKTTLDYQREFREMSMEMSDKLSFSQWVELYKKMVRWELELEKIEDPGMAEIFKMQKNEANNLFGKFIQKNYLGWLNGTIEGKPVLSPSVIKDYVSPVLKTNEKVVLFLVDNLRYDQWKIILPIIEEYYHLEKEEIYCTILPSATQYARNAFFAGLMPSEIEKKYPKYWLNEEDEGTKNQFEGELLGEQLKRLGLDTRFGFHKILNLNAGKKLYETMGNQLQNNFNVVVYNFVDMLSHARTEMEVLKELAVDEAAYRSLTLSWFEHSPLLDMVKYLASKKVSIIFTTDHGSIRVQNPSKVVGDRNTNTNLRYKTGRNLQYEKHEVLEIKNPAEAFLPRTNLSSSFIFAKENKFFAYPNNFNYYVNYYRDTFQHGGISLEEMLIPFAYLKPR